jgi:hypothetical protein
VAAAAAELSRLLMSTRRHDLGREVLGLKVTGTCRDGQLRGGVGSGSG